MFKIDMFSVVIPLYNKGNYVAKAIRSVLDQTCGDFEVIVIDDGSTDDGVKKVEAFADARITIIQRQNKGVSSARNAGVELAKHNHIAFLDADDWWDPHFLQEMKGLIEKYPDAGLYGSNFFLVKHGVNRPSTVGLDAGFTSGYIDYAGVYASTFCVPINCSFVVVPKTIFKAEGGFKTNLKYGEDFDLWIRLALKHKVAYINKPLAYSNQDVVAHGRALGANKLYTKEEYFIFNMDYLNPLESTNGQLKKLMDGLRVRALLRYYMNRRYMEDVKRILAKVDFKKQPVYYRRLYNMPLPLVKLYFSFRKLGSAAKQTLLRIF